MVSSNLLDVVLGVVFAWFILSLACSAVQESFNWLTRVRSKLMWRSLAQLFDTGVKAADARLRTAVIKRPEERKDLRPKPDPANPGSWYGRLFRKRIGDSPPQTQTLYGLIRRRVPEPAPGSLRTRISAVPTDVVGDAFESLAGQTVTRSSLLAVTDNVPLRAAIERLPDGVLVEEDARRKIPGDLAKEFDAAWNAAAQVVTIHDVEALLEKNPALLARVRAAVQSVAENEQVLRARQEIERWFDGAMEGLTTAFRRRNRKILAIIAVPVVLLSNSAVFGLVDRLEEDRDLRTAVAASAADWAAAELDGTETGTLDLEQACKRVLDVDTASTTTVPATSTTVPPTTAPASTAPPTTTEAESTTTTTTDPDAIEEARRRYRCATLLLESNELIGPLGWKQLSDEVSAASADEDLWTDLGSWLWPELLGRVLTWAALLFGAAFWYDVLKRIVGLKGKLAGSRSSASGDG